MILREIQGLFGLMQDGTYFFKAIYDFRFDVIIESLHFGLHLVPVLVAS